MNVKHSQKIYVYEDIILGTHVPRIIATMREGHPLYIVLLVNTHTNLKIVNVYKKEKIILYCIKNLKINTKNVTNNN